MADTPIQVTGRETKVEVIPSVGEVLSDLVKGWVAGVQDYAELAFRSLTNLAVGPRYFQDTLVQMDDIGVGSLPIILLSGFFIGAVMVLQTGSQFVRFGQTSLTGDVVAIALVRELGPTLTGLLVAGRCASGIASELGSMLVTPRVLATILMLPLLVALSDFIGLVGGCVASVFSLRLDAVEFWRRAIDALDFADLMQGFSKSLVFGFILATVGCYKGMTVRGGTQGVGRATTQAVVVASVLIIVADTFLTKLSLYLANKLF